MQNKSHNLTIVQIFLCFTCSVIKWFNSTRPQGTHQWDIYSKLRCPIRAIATDILVETTKMVKSRNNETMMVKTRKYDDEKPIARCWKVEMTKPRWWKTRYDFVFSPSYFRTFNILASLFRYFDVSLSYYRLLSTHCSDQCVCVCVCRDGP